MSTKQKQTKQNPQMDLSVKMGKASTVSKAMRSRAGHNVALQEKAVTLINEVLTQVRDRDFEAQLHMIRIGETEALTVKYRVTDEEGRVSRFHTINLEGMDNSKLTKDALRNVMIDGRKYASAELKYQKACDRRDRLATILDRAMSTTEYTGTVPGKIHKVSKKDSKSVQDAQQAYDAILVVVEKLKNDMGVCKASYMARRDNLKGNA